MSVKDNGQGIDPSILPKLFTKFATKSEIGGTGLGLFISKNIIEALTLIMQCYGKRLEIINSSPISYQAKEYMNQTRQLEQDVRQRERRIQEYLAKANLTQGEIENIIEPETVF